MKTPYRSIYDVLRLNRFIVLAVIVIAFVSSIISVFQMRKTQQDLLNKAFLIDQRGHVAPLKLTDQFDHVEVEALSHLDIFHRNFYGISMSNYEEQIEKSLWLGGESVDEVYRQKKADGVYNRLVQYGLVQKITSITSEVNLSKEPYFFQTRVNFEVLRGDTTDRYELMTTGNLIRIERNFPKNPHGLLITNFYENTLTKVNHEPR